MYCRKRVGMDRISWIPDLFVRLDLGYPVRPGNKFISCRMLDIQPNNLQETGYRVIYPAEYCISGGS